MSRYQLNPMNPEHTVTIGWDAPLDTYFAQVFIVQPDDSEEDDVEVLWRGFGGADRLTLAEACELLLPYAIDVPKPIIKQLAMDAAGAGRPARYSR